MAGMMKSIPLCFYFLVPRESVSIKNSSCSYNAKCIVKHLKNSSFNHHSPAFHFELACLIFFLAGKTELAKQVARYLHKDNKKVHQAIIC